jgi:hypothetical protein
MTALNCKVGDLAIVVNTELPQNLGQIVEVLGIQTGRPLVLSGHGHIWHVRAVSGRKTLVYRFNEVVIRFVEHAEGPAPDRCLRPVSGLTDDDGVSAGTEKRKSAPRRKSRPQVIVEACERALT